MKHVNHPVRTAIFVALALGCILSLVPRPLQADVHLPSIFSDHMVLARTEAVPVWGKANPGERVGVTLAGHTVETVADADGRWRVDVNLQNCGPGPFEMRVNGGNRITIHDAVVGDVWLASGQSNMEHLLRATADADREIANSANPLLRQFSVEKAGAAARRRKR